MQVDASGWPNVACENSHPTSGSFESRLMWDSCFHRLGQMKCKLTCIYLLVLLTRTLFLWPLCKMVHVIKCPYLKPHLPKISAKYFKSPSVIIELLSTLLGAPANTPPIQHEPIQVTNKYGHKPHKTQGQRSEKFTDLSLKHLYYWRTSVWVTKVVQYWIRSSIM